MNNNRVEFSHKSTGHVIVLIGAYFVCTKCNEVKPGSAFGMRSMHDGTIRNQPQCKPCRSSKAIPGNGGRPK